MLRPHRRLRGQMLAGAKADLEFERAVIAEQGGRVERTFRRHLHLRQKLLDKPLLPRAQLMPRPPPIEPADRRRVRGQGFRRRAE